MRLQRGLRDQRGRSTIGDAESGGGVVGHLLRVLINGVLCCALVVVALAAAPAVASPLLVATDPETDAALDTAPSQVQATFDQQLRAAFAEMTVLGPDGNIWSTGSPRVEGRAVSIDVLPLGPVGTYTVHYRVQAADGHTESGSWPFRLMTPGAAIAPPPAGSSGASAGLPAWLSMIIAVVVTGGVWWLFRRPRRD